MRSGPIWLRGQRRGFKSQPHLSYSWDPEPQRINRDGAHRGQRGTWCAVASPRTPASAPPPPHPGRRPWVRQVPRTLCEHGHPALPSRGAKTGEGGRKRATGEPDERDGQRVYHQHAPMRRAFTERAPCARRRSGKRESLTRPEHLPGAQDGARFPAEASRQARGRPSRHPVLRRRKQAPGG